jgi:hypothetical protein
MIRLEVFGVPKRLNLQRGTLTGRKWEEEHAQEMTDI